MGVSEIRGEAPLHEKEFLYSFPEKKKKKSERKKEEKKSVTQLTALLDRHLPDTK